MATQTAEVRTVEVKAQAFNDGVTAGYPTSVTVTPADKTLIADVTEVLYQGKYLLGFDLVTDKGSWRFWCRRRVTDNEGELLYRIYETDVVSPDGSSVTWTFKLVND